MTTLPTSQPLHSRSCGPLKGTIKVPGDKSLSHRALIFGALTVGETRIEGLLEGEDVLATAEALRALGAEITRDEAGVWHVWGRGIGGLKAPSRVLDLGNSGTGARLLMGVVAGQPIRATFTGDASLSSRPMGRIFDPLKQMGAAVTAAAGDQLPATVTGPARLRPMSYELPKPSAQIKSAVLLAGLAAPGITEVIEPEPTRDHTERMARAFGASVEVTDKDGKRHIRLTGQPELVPVPVSIASDPSSAAFPAVAALITKGSELVIEGVMTNPTRTGLYKTLTEMGADIAFQNEREVAGENLGDLVVRSSALKGVEVPASRAPSMIDEYPMLAVAAAFAKGPTVMHGLAELRVKESDRLSAIAEGLKAIGVNVTETEDSLTVEGCNGEVPGDGTIATHMDHRIAMAFLVAGTATRASVKVDDGAFIETSFPGFADLMNGLGAKIERSNR